MKDGTHKMIRKALLRIGVPALLAFMTVNAFLAVNHLKQMQHIARLAHWKPRPCRRTYPVF